MKNVFREIHRRSLWQVLGIYVLGSWVALQVVDTLGSTVGLPDWFGPVALGLLIIGLPIVLATALVQGGPGSSRAATARPFADPEQQTQAATAEAQPAEPPPAPGAHHRLFTWRNAIAGGVVAFALLGLGTVAWTTLRALGIGPAGTLVAKGVIDEAGRIVLAEFDDRAGDASLAESVTELMRTDIGQSPTVHLVETDELSAVLERMQRPADTRISVDVAREIAEREGLKAVLAGEVANVGGATVVSVRLITADGETLIPMRETANDTTGIIDAVDRLSKRLRERLGESLRSVAASPPLDRTTTASLPALRLYTEARRLVAAGQQFESTDLLRQATAIDPDFAWAHYHLSIELRNVFIERAEQIEAMSRAFELRERLPEADRWIVEAAYYMPPFKNDLQKALQAFRTAIVLDPTDKEAVGNYGWTLRWARQDEESERQYQRLLALDTMDALSNVQVVRILQNLDRRPAADSALAAMQRRLPDHPWTPWHAVWSRIVWEDYGGAAAMIPGVRPSNPDLADIADYWLDILHGRIALYLDEEQSLAGLIDPASFAIYDFLGDVYLTTALDLGVPRRAIARLDSLTEERLSGIPPTDPIYLELASGWARLGRPDRAAATLRQFDEATPEGFLGEHEPRRHLAAGSIALAEGRVDDGIAAFRAADIGSCVLCALPALARAYDEAGQLDSVIAVWDRYLTTRFWGPHDLAPIDRPLAHERLGQLYDERGDVEKAIEHYARFVELWADADDVLQPRVVAAQARLQELVEARG